MRLSFLCFPYIPGHSQIDDCLYPKAFKILNSFDMWLGTSVKAIVDLTKVENAFLRRQTTLASKTYSGNAYQSEGYEEKSNAGVNHCLRTEVKTGIKIGFLDRHPRMSVQILVIRTAVP